MLYIRKGDEDLKKLTLFLLSIFLSFEFAVTADESWKAPLSEKAGIMEGNILQNHWIDGLYPSQVALPADYTTQGHCNIAHSVCWTEDYLGGQCYRYLFMKDEESKEHCDQIFEAIYRCQLVTGVRGLQARGYAFGHGDSYEERGGSTKSNYWYQGAGKYKDLRWRGDQSHHNYDSSTYGLAIYYDLVAQGKQKERAREAIDALVGYWADTEDMMIRQEHGRSIPILGFTDGKTPNSRIIMAAHALKVAHHATGKKKYAELYEKLITQYQFRTWREEVSGVQGFDDGHHIIQDLENLFRIEEDPKLKEFYRHVADRLWEAHKNDKQSLFTYIYFSLVPDAPGKEKALEGALETLQSYPANTIFRPRMNSIRKDIETKVDRRGEKVSKNPLPVYEAPWDNEYMWKGSLYPLDGWFSRVAISVAVPEEDPVVMYATDGRDIYKTVDGGRSWIYVSENLNANPQKLDCGYRIRFLYVATDNGFYKTSTAGTEWHKLSLPEGSGNPVDICVDTENRNVLYAITDKGVYRSLDFGEEWIGERWECLTEIVPPGELERFYVGLGEEPVIYAQVGNTIYHKQADDGDWIGGDGRSYFLRSYPWMAIDPVNPYTIYRGARVDYGQYKGNFLSVSRDAGGSWSFAVEQFYKKYREGGWKALMAEMFGGGTVHGLAIDPHNSDILYAAADDGAIISRDRGKSWKVSNKGLEIPRANTIFAPASTEDIFAGTPAGLFVSHDKGESWENANLVLIFEKNEKRDMGGAAYLDAYWRARYFGFIDQELADMSPEKW